MISNIHKFGHFIFYTSFASAISSAIATSTPLTFLENIVQLKKKKKLFKSTEDNNFYNRCYQNTCGFKLKKIKLKKKPQIIEQLTVF